MFIIDVIPLARASKGQPQTLSYYHEISLPLYSLVRAPIRKKMVPALVFAVHNISAKKAELKSQSFKLKGGVKAVANSDLFDERYLRFVQFLCDYYLCSLGVGLRTALPRYLMSAKKLPPFERPEQREASQKEKPKNSYIWGDTLYRLKEYKKLISGALERKEQVLFLVPERSSLEYYRTFLATCTKEEDIAVLSSDSSNKQYFLEWMAIREKKKHVVLGTRSAVFSCFADLSLVILDQENNASHKSWDMHPKYDTRTLAAFAAHTFNALYVMGDALPRVESYYHIEKGHLRLQSAEKEHRLPLSPQIIDMKNASPDGTLAPYVRQLLKGASKEKKALVLVNRRGDSPITLCRDCGYAERCPSCTASLILHAPTRPGSKELLKCHHCGFSKAVETLCPHCKGSRLASFGIGIQKVEAEIRSLCPGSSVLRIDSDSANEHILWKEQINKADIIVCTTFALQFLRDTAFEYSVIASADNLFAIPDFRIGERFMGLIYMLGAITHSAMVVQTYQPDNYLFILIGAGEPLETFYKKELELRKPFWYPPYSHLVRIVFEAKTSAAAKEKAETAKKSLTENAVRFALRSVPGTLPFDILGPASAFIEQKKGVYRWHLLLKDKEKKYSARKNLLSVLPPDAMVDADPINVV
jgi:primosomal protein N' (replication factor Y)